MPIYTLECPDCGHEFRGMVMEGTQPPSVWVCSECGSERAGPRADAEPEAHPWEKRGHGGGCACCG